MGILTSPLGMEQAGGMSAGCRDYGADFQGYLRGMLGFSRLRPSVFFTRVALPMAGRRHQAVNLSSAFKIRRAKRLLLDWGFLQVCVKSLGLFME